ncbi:T9SS type A sorting domain-containing protein [Spirosoma sp. BT702]|uniref:T9SS type A sorting domain-containing protein n=1 Tax=Spirosoma profusum TaxID=2771354 RepID=A0A926Y407_9BACT|nr:T9SS type A sorting domain-containing protein [Spirosoma profusum]MBD2702515.1 T9SS type A sorting domain-containing protein [Spirosoma profusum]
MNHWMLRGILVVVWFIVAVNNVTAQKSGGTVPYSVIGTPAYGPRIVYYKDERNALTTVPAPESILKNKEANGRLAAPTAQFIVTYNNFTTEAKQAFQYAVDIWSTLISSPVPIRIQANWGFQTPNVLGSAGPGSYRYNFDGGQRANAFYPIALAEKIARRELNAPEEADIIADFNRNNDWYFGTDGKTPKGQTDMVTAVLHELAHGLGFIGFFTVVGDNGLYTQALASIYDQFIETGQGKRLVTSTKEFPNDSEELKLQLAGHNLFINGSTLKQSTGDRAKVYAPYNFDPAASVYHLNEDTYPPGNINSLMTPLLAQAEVIHSPGPIVMNFLADMEWKTTSVLHEPIIGSEDPADLVFSTRIISDTTLTPGSVRLYYRKTQPTAKDSVFTTVTPTQVGTTSEYRFTLPAAQSQGDIWYYLSAKDVAGRTFTNPGRLINGTQLLYHTQSGPDNVAPTIQYVPTKNVMFATNAVDSLPIYARIKDNRAGISAAYVEYKINGVAQPNLNLKFTKITVNGFTYDSMYVNRINFPANSLKAGDKITYRIVAVDMSKAKNQVFNPANGFYELPVLAPRAARDQYVTTFSDATSASDFIGYGFSVTTAAGFSDPAIHSEHPYRNGADFKAQSNYEYVLLSPIRIKANPDSAVIRFDEIVLIEPSEPGSKLGDANFYDYVLVEGSSNNGQTWRPLVDAYSSRDKAEWLNAYKASIVADNSTTAGTPALYRRREIPLLKQGSAFKAGDQILIRFRMFADQLSYGWGWAIDNLRIQAAPPAIVLAEEPTRNATFSLYPNPVNGGSVRIVADLPNVVSEVNLRLIGLSGQAIRQQTLKVSGSRINDLFDMGQLPTGLYFLQLKANDLVITQKVLVAD